MSTSIDPLAHVLELGKQVTALKSEIVMIKAQASQDRNKFELAIEDLKRKLQNIPTDKNGWT